MSVRQTVTTKDFAGTSVLLNTAAGFAQYDVVVPNGTRVFKCDINRPLQHALGDGVKTVSQLAFGTVGTTSDGSLLALYYTAAALMGETLGTAAESDVADFDPAGSAATAESNAIAAAASDATTKANAAEAAANSYADGKVANDLTASTTVAPSKTAVNTALGGKQDTITTGTSGQYFDGTLSLQTFPSIPAAQVNSDWNAVSGAAQILNKPSIPASQVQSDWTQASSGAVDFIKNKPTTMAPSGAAGGDLGGTYPSPTVSNSVRHRIYINGTLKPGTIQYLTSATSSGSTVTFNLTTDGTASGTAIFTNVYTESFALWVNNTAIDFRFANGVLAGNKRTITFDVAQRTFTGIVLLSTNILGSTQVVNLSGGTTVYFSVIGD